MYLYRYRRCICCLMLYTCWARIPLVQLPFHYYNRNNGKQFEQTIIEWPMGLVVISNARLAKKYRRMKKPFVLIWFPSVFSLRDCVLRNTIAMLLYHFSPFFKAHVNIIWNSQHNGHVKGNMRQQLNAYTFLCSLFIYSLWRTFWYICELQWMNTHLYTHTISLWVFLYIIFY